MADIIVQRIQAHETYPLRAQVIRPGQTLEQIKYAGDDQADSVHFGAFLDQNLIGVITLHLHSMPGRDGCRAWEIRGTAVSPTAQRKGVGSKLAASCFAHIRESHGTICWCYARTAAADFYRSLGMKAQGPPTQSATVADPSIQQYLMWRYL